MRLVVWFYLVTLVALQGSGSSVGDPIATTTTESVSESLSRSLRQSDGSNIKNSATEEERFFSPSHLESVAKGLNKEGGLISKRVREAYVKFVAWAYKVLGKESTLFKKAPTVEELLKSSKNGKVSVKSTSSVPKDQSSDTNTGTSTTSKSQPHETSGENQELNSPPAANVHDPSSPANSNVEAHAPGPAALENTVPTSVDSSPKGLVGSYFAALKAYLAAMRSGGAAAPKPQLEALTEGGNAHAAGPVASLNTVPFVKDRVNDIYAAFLSAINSFRKAPASGEVAALKPQLEPLAKVGEAAPPKPQLEALTRVGEVHAPGLAALENTVPTSVDASVKAHAFEGDALHKTSVAPMTKVGENHARVPVASENAVPTSVDAIVKAHTSEGDSSPKTAITNGVENHAPGPVAPPNNV